jgi:hypothetical protein
MTVNVIGQLAGLGVVGWFLSLCVLILASFLRGDISIRNLLAHHIDGRLRLHRLQSLLVTLVLAGVLVVKSLRIGPTMTLPDISLPMLIAVAASYGLLLGGKAFSR